MVTVPPDALFNAAADCRGTADLCAALDAVAAAADAVRAFLAAHPGLCRCPLCRFLAAGGVRDSVRGDLAAVGVVAAGLGSAVESELPARWAGDPPTTTDAGIPASVIRPDSRSRIPRF